MNTSTLFANAVKNLYLKKIYTVDFAILKAEELSNRNRINATDYTELLTYLADEQEKSMEVIETAVEETIVEGETAQEQTEEPTPVI